MVEIAIKNLTVDYIEKRQVIHGVNGLSAVFPASSFNVVVGSSGCGKTTLLRAVAGFIAYDGEILFDGEDIDDVPTQKRNVAYVSQQYVLYSHLTIFDNIAFPLKIKGATPKEITATVKDIAEKMGLTCCLTRRPKHISGGQQQRVAIARALVKRPSVCLLDEPLSNVDPQLRNTVRIQMKETLKSLGCTVIYVTHDFQEAMALADNIFVMDEGNIAVTGKPGDVYKSQNDAVKQLRGSGDMLW